MPSLASAFPPSGIIAVRGGTFSVPAALPDSDVQLEPQIYGLVVSVLIFADLSATMSLARGFIQLGAGLAVGLTDLAAGFAIGIVGDAGVRGTAQQPRLFVGMILILIFFKVLGFYGLVVRPTMNMKVQAAVGVCSQ
ncbi:hypothetical protein NMY22_g7515 [Coprinellus aureogranulatus]|nr:hypothetical protein NMY22_g7515 [Coprinellus aureogranulatus]